MQYTVTEINNGVATVEFSDGSWTFIQLSSDMSEADLDDAVYRMLPPQLKQGSAPAFLSVGDTRAATEKTYVAQPDYTDDMPQWLKDRQNAYGTVSSQIEYITENGLEAWQTHVAQIKADNPKTLD